jgi:cytochrome o ubiquinol oxidase subunit 1
MVMGFAMIWYIWWLAALSLVVLVAAIIIHTFNYNRDYYVPADEVAESENARGRPAVTGA